MKPSVVAQTLFTIALLPSLAAVRELGIAAQTGTQEISRGTKCDVTGSTKITITCDYTPASRDASTSDAVPRIVLNHALLSFETTHQRRIHGPAV